MTVASSDVAVRAPARLSRAIATGVVAFVCALGLVFGAAMPANATAMRAITGTIKCNAYPNVTVGTSATARGSVAFQLMAIGNAQSLYFVNLGYSSQYTNWSWKFWTKQAGNFYAYGYGGNGAVSSVSRWCHNIGA